MLQPEIKVMVNLLDLEPLKQQWVLNRLSHEEKLRVFEQIKGLGIRLPGTHNWRGLDFIEFPDGLQIEECYRPWGTGLLHRVSNDFYANQLDAYNALILGIVSWNIIEHPEATVGNPYPDLENA